MNIDYWLLETQEDVDNYEMSLGIASPAEMAHAIKRVLELCVQDSDAVALVSVREVLKAIDGIDE